MPTQANCGEQQETVQATWDPSSNHRPGFVSGPPLPVNRRDDSRQDALIVSGATGLAITEEGSADKRLAVSSRATCVMGGHFAFPRRERRDTGFYYRSVGCWSSVDATTTGPSPGAIRQATRQTMTVVVEHWSHAVPCHGFGIPRVSSGMVGLRSHRWGRRAGNLFDLSPLMPSWMYYPDRSIPDSLTPTYQDKPCPLLAFHVTGWSTILQRSVPGPCRA